MSERHLKLVHSQKEVKKVPTWEELQEHYGFNVPLIQALQEAAWNGGR